jgi:hypothetical protein
MIYWLRYLPKHGTGNFISSNALRVSNFFVIGKLSIRLSTVRHTLFLTIHFYD